MADLDLTRFVALVVDDNSFIRLSLKKELTHIGFKEICEAANGIDALQMLDKNPDIIICDINMEPLNGFEFVKHVRALQAPANEVPIIFLTGDAHEEQVQSAMKLAIDGYLLKPVSQESLKKKVVALMSRKKKTVFA